MFPPQVYLIFILMPHLENNKLFIQKNLIGLVHIYLVLENQAQPGI